ncbi:MAG: tRNA (adenosine(37)-N6)-dimethylallyltransferase MiaA [Mariniblastus sp.]|nr:tRNA (adenosine(37)-N6)-dimethylallyltransferase MiaA [Mariniblastus sp.]MDG2180910.1 tRNA (adenosine(37)-N6)-dimethylallyltransferase MiaA [Mariniblastus sp.]
MNQPPSDIQLALKCWFLTGATASGKTKVSLELARILDAEIISLDSMAIYRGMDIGTAKPDSTQQSAVPHHLIDIVDPPESFSVSEYRDSALSKIREIHESGKQVLFVGGTALYLKALLRGLFEGPPADWDFRKEIEQEIENSGAEFLHQRLAMIDPVSAHKLHENDHRRIIRALEVYKQTGKPISHWQMQFDEGRQADQCRVFTIRHDRPVLHQRIEARVEAMFSEGLVDEVRGLLERWSDIGKTASQAVGYREVIDFLSDKMSMEETVERVRVRTRKFARHQETWFRGMSECRILDLESEFDPSELAQKIASVGSEVTTS